MKFWGEKYIITFYGHVESQKKKNIFVASHKMFSYKYYPIQKKGQI